MDVLNEEKLLYTILKAFLTQKAYNSVLRGLALHLQTKRVSVEVYYARSMTYNAIFRTGIGGDR